MPVKDINKTLFIMNARTESERVPEKMVREFSDSCLFEIAVKKVLACESVPKDNFYVSVRDLRLVDIAQRNGVNIWHRSKESCKEPITLQGIFEWHTELSKRFDYYVNVNACNPIVRTSTIESFIEQFMNTEANGLLAVTSHKNLFWGEDNRLINKFNGDRKYLATMETKLAETVYQPANCLYAGRMSDIANDVYMGSFTKKGDPEFFLFPNEENFDIDEMWQFNLAQFMYNMIMGK